MIKKDHTALEALALKESQEENPADAPSEGVRLDFCNKLFRSLQNLKVRRDRALFTTLFLLCLLIPTHFQKRWVEEFFGIDVPGQSALIFASVVLSLVLLYSHQAFFRAVGMYASVNRTLRREYEPLIRQKDALLTGEHLVDQARVLPSFLWEQPNGRFTPVGLLAGFVLIGAPTVPIWSGIAQFVLYDVGVLVFLPQCILSVISMFRMMSAYGEQP